jgi:hypothetical protein
MLNDTLLDRIIFARMAETETETVKGRTWTEEEDRFLRENIAIMTDAEIGEQLGRSENAVHLRWSRDLQLPSRSKHPDVITALQAARLLGIDGHKTAGWIDMGLLPGRLMPGRQTKFNTIRLIDRIAFRRWVLNPMNWVYFDPKKVRDPELKRMCQKRAARWGDAWWTVRQVADYHGVNIKNVEQTIARGKLRSFQPPVALGGRHWDRRWAFHFVLKSDAVAATFYTGKGSQKKISRFTPAADVWILKARDELGMTFIGIGRTMKIGKWNYVHRTNPIIAYRYRQLKAHAAKKRRVKR